MKAFVKRQACKMISPPKKMRIIAIDEAAEFEQNLIEDTVDVPVPSSGEVLIKVAYAGINRPDILQRKGMHPPAPGAPAHPGLEVSGHIVAFGDHTESETSALSIGDAVCALLGGGGYGEYVCAPISCCLPLPESLSLREAASLPECLWTVWNNLFLRGELTCGETVLIHGGTSGIGHFALQMAKAAGAKVIATAGHD
jgi:NADPH:quinone reductase-like Zn-dependent oxidoreductase